MRAAWRRPTSGRPRSGCMATLPELTLMQRAAAGLARRCAALLADRGGVYGSRVLLLVGRGQQRRRRALRRRPAGPARGARSGRCCWTRTGPTPTGWRRCGGPAGGSVDRRYRSPQWTWSSTASSASAPRVRCAEPPPRRSRRWPRVRERRRPADRGERRRTAAVWTWTPARSRARPYGPTSRSRSAASSPRWWSARRRRWPGRSTWSTSGCRGSDAAPAVWVPDVADVGRLVAAPGRRLGQVHPRRGRPRHRLARLPRARRCCRSPARSPARPGWSATPARSPTTSSGPTRRWWSSHRVAEAGRVQAWLFGCGTRHRRARPGRATRRARLVRTGRCSTPTR